MVVKAREENERLITCYKSRPSKSRRHQREGAGSDLFESVGRFSARLSSNQLKSRATYKQSKSPRQKQSNLCRFLQAVKVESRAKGTHVCPWGGLGGGRQMHALARPEGGGQSCMPPNIPDNAEGSQGRPNTAILHWLSGACPKPLLSLCPALGIQSLLQWCSQGREGWGGQSPPTQPPTFPS